MKIKELIERLSKYDGELEVLTKKTEIFGNVAYVNDVRDDSYGFFGMSIPCVMLTDEYPASEDDDD